MLFSFLYPSMQVDSTYAIDFEKLYEQGMRGVMFDIDNTLVCHGAPADERAKALFSRLQEIGFAYGFVSNNKEPRVQSFASEVGGFYFYRSGKPSPKSYLAGMERMGTTKENTLFVGDQLLTDIWGANRAEITSVLVRPIDKKEEIQIVIKRFIEKFIMFTWRLSGK